MSDHASGPRAFADPVIDITDMFAFPSPERSGVLVLVLDVFPFASMSALFSDAVDYRFRVRPMAVESRAGASKFAVSDKEYTFGCRFSVPVGADEDSLPVQEGRLSASTGHDVSFRVNDEQGGRAQGVRAFAGVRMDPFFFDGGGALQTLMTGKLAFADEGHSTMFRQNVLSIVIELDVASAFDAGDGPLFAIVGETLTAGSLPVRLERYGRPEIKNLLILPMQADTVNRQIELRDLYNQEDAFNLGPAYAAALRTRANGNLAFWDGLDGKTDWPLDTEGIHPLTEFLLADFMVIDVSKPYAEDTYLEIERAVLAGTPHRTCGGRAPNDDAVDTFITLMVNAGKGPRVSDGVDQQAVRCSQTFPYLAAPEPNPPTPKAPAIVAR